MLIDFVKTPYTTGPYMIKNTGPVFNKEPNTAYMKAKVKELVQPYGNDLWGHTKECAETNLIRTVAEKLELEPSSNIVDLAMQVEEDIAIMYKGKLSAICFCFPSSWIPYERLGMELGEIHKPVADGETLIKASPKIAETMCQQASMKRWVWTITNNSDLSNHPYRKINKIPQSIDDLFFRVETQTTMSIDQDTSVFFVKVEVCPLKDVWCQQILDSVNSMSDAVLTYKNLHDIKKLLNQGS